MMATTADELEQYRAMDRVRSVQEAEMAKKKGLRRWNRLMAADEVRMTTATPVGRCYAVFRPVLIVSCFLGRPRGSGVTQAGTEDAVLSPSQLCPPAFDEKHEGPGSRLGSTGVGGLRFTVARASVISGIRMRLMADREANEARSG